MLAAYFDEAGGKDHGFIVVAGYVATTAQWERFDADWRLLLAKYSVPYFHMKEFAQSVKAFKEWKGKEGTRINFLKTVSEIIKENVFQCYASLVPYDEFGAINLKYRLTGAVGNEYALAGRTCVSNATQWLRARERDLNVAYFFEDGAKGKGYLQKIMQRDKLPAPIFKPSRDRGDEKGLLPLQAADFAAYELRKVFADDPREEWPLYKYRRPLHTLSSIPGYWGKWTQKDLVEFCEKAGVARRLKQE